MAQRQTITCKLTGVTGPSVDAHIIPRSLYQLDGKPAKLIYVGENNYREHRSAVGIYDPEILTIEGESYFSECDDFAAKFLLNRRDYNANKTAHIRQHRGVPLIAEIDEPNQRMLKLFCMSVLWRASVSGQLFFKNVDLGLKHEARLKELILSNSTGREDEYNVILMRHTDTPDYGLPILAPASDRLENVRCYKFNLPQASFLIKVDQRGMPRDFKDFSVGAAPTLRVLLLEPFKAGVPYRLLKKHARFRLNQRPC